MWAWHYNITRNLEGVVTMSQWLNRLENRCNPVVAWAAAVAAVVTLAPAALLWLLLNGGGETGRKPAASLPGKGNSPLHSIAA